MNLNFPRSFHLTSLASVPLYFAREYDERFVTVRERLPWSQNFLQALMWLGLGYEQNGMFEEAIAQFIKAKDVNDDSIEPLESPGYVLAITGRKDEARKILAELHEGLYQCGSSPALFGWWGINRCSSSSNCSGPNGFATYSLNPIAFGSICSWTSIPNSP